MTVEQQQKDRLDAARLHAVPIRELTEADRPALLAHLLGLAEDDRYLRFGSPLGDPIISRYVAGIDLIHDVVFGVFNDELDLIAAGHFARTRPAPESEGTPRSAEFGLSVSASGRGRGVGTALFVRAATHARNQGIGVLFMHCLTQNKAMMRIARKAGMQISLSYGEANAFIALPPGDAASRVAEAMQEQIALFDYAVKQQMAGLRTWWPRLGAAQSS